LASSQLEEKVRFEVRDLGRDREEVKGQNQFILAAM
jgi:hypothetical protein